MKFNSTVEMDFFFLYSFVPSMCEHGLGCLITMSFFGGDKSYY